MAERRRIEPSEPSDDYVKEIMEREAEIATREPPEVRKRTGARLLGVLAPIAVALLVWNIVMLTAEPEIFTPAEEEASARFSIFLAAEAIEAFQDSAGVLPQSLADLALDDDDIQYVREDGSYALTAEADGRIITYRSGEDVTEFENALDVFGTEGGR